MAGGKRPNGDDPVMWPVMWPAISKCGSVGVAAAGP